ncbi:MAG: hypothetical protein ACHQ6T_02990 [Myxococcota bacterium]
MTRRALLQGGALALAAVALLPRRLRADAPKFALDQAAQDALAKGQLVYVSPLKSDGRESRCHAEVWYFFDRGAVVIATATSGWKARALKGGRDKARLWVGDFGPYSRAGEKLRGAPTFLASAALDAEPATFERLLASYGTRYPDEWAKWKPRFESSHADGSRCVIRYTPIGE